MPREWATGIIGGWILSGAKGEGREEYEALLPARETRSICGHTSVVRAREVGGVGVDRQVGSATCGGVPFGPSCATAASGRAERRGLIIREGGGGGRRRARISAAESTSHGWVVSISAMRVSMLSRR